MRHNSEIILYQVSEEGDGFGGKSNNLTNPIFFDATVSVRSNELSPKPSGLGYYRIVTILIEKDILKVKDMIEHDNVKYNITRRVLYKHSFLEAFIGYEV